MGNLTIHRDPAFWSDRARAYIIVIDDEPHGKIMHGETISIALDPGPHRVRMKIDWCGSKELRVDGTRRCAVGRNPARFGRYS